MKVLDWLKNKIETERRMKAIQKSDCYKRSREYLKAHIEGQKAYLENPLRSNKTNPYDCDCWSFWFLDGSSERHRGWNAGWAYEWYKDFKKELEEKRATK